MAIVTISEQDRQITDAEEISEFLAPFGIWFENWDVESKVGADAEDQQILDAYSAEIQRLKEKGGFVTADVINVSPDTPNLDAMLDKFNKEHTHSEDEVRFTVKGRGVFHIHPDDGPVFGILVERGDLINVPAGTKHWFNLCDDRTIRCIRLFTDTTGWAAQYVDDPVHAGYAPVCLGPEFIDPSDEIDPMVKL
ncbi:MAG: acireductone dioxygenase [Pirellulaceae bacterium]|jgi:1,2-dihydroxy-3-keto-5-methylthiopentene dioxygenase|nr:acireductone dioxygenase [Planctomycetaceae bacterium]HIM31227.1 acireductone dioxygenase [Planctomycetota bacterium]